MAENLAEPKPQLHLVEKSKKILIDQATQMQLAYTQTLESLGGSLDPKAQHLINFLKGQAEMFLEQLDPEERDDMMDQVTELSRKLAQGKEK